MGQLALLGPSLIIAPLDSPVDFKQVMVKEVSKELTRTFIERYHHYPSYTPSVCNLALLFLDTVLGVTSFDMGSFPNYGKLMSKGLFDNRSVWQMRRTCCADYAPKFTAGVLLSKVIKYVKRYHPNIKMLTTAVVASEGEVGTAWQATNWVYVGKTQARNGRELHRYLFPLEQHEEIIRRYAEQVLPYPKRVQQEGGKQNV